MKCKEFTLLQLLNVIDGRVFTTFDDAKEVLSHVFGEPVHELNYADKRAELLDISPMWLRLLRPSVDTLKIMADDNVEAMIKMVNEKGYNYPYQIPQL